MPPRIAETEEAKMQNKITITSLVLSVITIIILIWGTVTHINRIVAVESQNALLLQIIENQNKILCDCSE